MNNLASLYIDNELTIEEKLTFIDRITLDPPFYEDTRSLILQEKVLRTRPGSSIMPDKPPGAIISNGYLKKLLKPAIYAAAGFVLAMVLMTSRAPGPQPQYLSNRFVLYEPAVSRVELTGTFTGWRKVPMLRIGNTGYWELNLDLPSGEHRFAYILDGTDQIADPTVPVREHDDFGGENSILNVEVHT